MKTLLKNRTNLGFAMTLALAFILTMATEILTIGIYELFNLLPSVDERSMSWLARGFALIPVLSFCAYLRNRLTDVFVVPGSNTKNLTKWILIGIVFGIVFFIGFQLSKHYWTNAENFELQKNVSGFRIEIGLLGLFPAILSILISDLLIPIVEEFVFRGLLFQSIARRFNYASAYLVSAALFACIHPSFHTTTFCFGLCSCALMHMSGRLAPCIAMHAIYNSLITWNALS